MVAGAGGVPDPIAQMAVGHVRELLEESAGRTAHYKGGRGHNEGSERPTKSPIGITGTNSTRENFMI